MFGIYQYADWHHRGAVGLCLILTFVLTFWFHFSAVLAVGTVGWLVAYLKVLPFEGE